MLVGLDSLQGLQAARIFSAHGIPVCGIVADRTHPASYTNTIEKLVLSQTDGEPLLTTLIDLAAGGWAGSMLVPCQDKSVRTIANAAQELGSDYRFVLPRPDVVEMMMDKVSFVAYAERVGFSVPKTVVLEHKDDVDYAASRLRFPCLLKPSIRGPLWDLETKKKVLKIATPEELASVYETSRHWADTLIAQEWVEGDDTHLYSCNCYLASESGEPLVTFTARKLRQWPPEAGTSCLGEEVREQRIADMAMAIFTGVPYRGLAYLEVKKDSLTGEYFVIEANVGRPTGRSALAEAAGVELLYTMYCDVFGLPLPDKRLQRFVGAKWIDLRHDVQSVLHYWRTGELTLRQWLASWRGLKAFAILSWRDPLPFIVDLKRASTMALARLPAVGRQLLQKL